MIRYVSSVFLAAVTMCLTLPATAQVTLTGAIDDFRIELQLDRDGEAGLTGRYRYAGRDAWLDLEGTSFGGQAVRLTERFDGVQTGHFYLDYVDGGFSGFWTDRETGRKVMLSSDIDVATLIALPPAQETGQSVTGHYEINAYWVNEMWAPEYEIGFNGGTADVLRVADGQVFVQFRFTVGPTYHSAWFSGVAQKIAPDTYEYKQALEGEDEACHLNFQFGDGSLRIDDNLTSRFCQFGARAHANFDLAKTSDTASFEEM